MAAEGMRDDQFADNTSAGTENSKGILHRVGKNRTVRHGHGRKTRFLLRVLFVVSS